MGCYNGEGCISGLPIHYGDPIGGLLCLSISDYNVSEIRKQLAKAEEMAQLHYDIEAARCPLCGGTMEVKTHKSEQYYTVYISASIRCSKCGVFGAKVDLQDELSCHSKGYDEQTALSRAWSKINQYIKVK